ncbi:serine O-acetyltransferase EpsC [Taylorella equigenitalis]|uniref:serine O-acetyltransferase EpsC n=1 Tax=Taylorella equigenitalis TaxID=29575 RepID=UPI00041CB7E6|nr:serine O-acetyltransferase EpsC [Taylorella equigenitalis]ASY29970.1 serine acetyltransferase [Taylorella equigenitalis]KOS59017.1 serine acetyltransferase [Taylorella equigenitalis]
MKNDDIFEKLKESRLSWQENQKDYHVIRGVRRPSRTVIGDYTKKLVSALFPLTLGPADLQFSNVDNFVSYTINNVIKVFIDQAALEFGLLGCGDDSSENCKNRAEEAMEEFAEALPTIHGLVEQDVTSAYRGDPAAKSYDEILMCYPGIHAMIYHRIAHELYRLGLTLMARIISEISHSNTGIDIHPGAQIAGGCFIDHGTGVVIGETCIIGQNVRIYQAVTLGAKSFPADLDGSLKKGLLRHPIVEDNVVIYAGATVLGRITIGKNAVIPGNAWITKDVDAVEG